MAHERSDVPGNPWWILGLGVLLGSIGSLIAVSDDAPTWFGYAILWAGGTLALVGIVGAGVTLGTVRAEWVIRNGRR